MIYFLDQQGGPVGQWVMDAFGRKAIGPFRAIGALNDEGRLVAGVVLNNYNGANVDITVRAPQLIRPAGLRVVFEFIFHDLRCTRVTARVRRGRMDRANDLARGREYMKRMGFQIEICAPEYYGKGRANAAYVFRMLREDCPWISENAHLRRKEHGHGRARAARSQGNRSRSIRPEQANGSGPAANGHGQPARPNGHAAV